MDRGWLRAEGLKTGVLVALLIKVEVYHCPGSLLGSVQNGGLLLLAGLPLL